MSRRDHHDNENSCCWLRPRTAFLIGAVCLLLSYLIVQLPQSSVISLTNEDGLIESIGALSLFAASWCSVILYRRSRGNYRRAALLLAFVLFVAGGEELSWGQRIFGFTTPEWLAQINRQGETNLHNIELFQYGHRFMSLNRLFTIFCLSFCVVLPIASLVRQRRQYHCQSSQPGGSDSPPRNEAALPHRPPLPVPSLAVGILAGVNVLLFHLHLSLTAGRTALVHPLNEIKETNYAIVLLLAVLSLSRPAATARHRDHD